MAALSKRRKSAREKVDPNTSYAIDEALGLVKEMATAKFPESIEMSVNRTTADNAAARIRQCHFTESSEQGSHQEDR